MKGKKIVFVLPGMEAGGAERVASILLNSAVERGFDVTLVMLLKDNIHYELDGKINVVSLNQLIREQGRSFNYLVRMMLLRKIVKEINPDLLISFMAKTAMFITTATLGLRVPKIASERDTPSTSVTGFIQERIRNLSYDLSLGVIFQTEDARDYFNKHIQKNSVVISNPVKNNLPDWEGKLSDEHFVAVGRLDAQKNYPMMIKAFSKYVKKHPGAKLSICGEGNIKDELEALVKEEDIIDSVEFMGVLKNVHEMTKTASVYLMTSDHEGIPNALLESMAMGMPCISTDCPCGGVRSLIKDGENGFMVPVGDSDVMFNKMEQVMGMGDKINEISKAAKAVKETNSEQKICDEYFKYFKKFIS